MNSQFAQTDVVVIGGGMAGLAAACYLSRAGKAVTLFEKAASLGGRAATQNYEGYSFNRGIHALYCGGAAEHVLRELGISYSGHRPTGIFALRQGKLHLVPRDPFTLLRTDLLDFADKLELTRLFTVLLQLKAQELQHVSTQEWLEHAIRRSQVRQFMAAFARTYTYSAALDLVSAEVFIAKIQLTLKHPILYIDGGWQTMVEGLRKAAEQAGVRIVSGIRVENLEYQGGRVQGVRLGNDEIIHAAAIIIATNPHEAVKLVDESASPALHQMVNAIVPAQVACLDVALSRLPDAQHPVVQDLEHPRFMSAQSLFARIAPAEGALIHAFKQLDPAHPTEPREDERDLEDLLDTVQPGWRDVLVKRIYLPRIEASGMLPTARDGGFAGRPDVQVPGFTNLYLVGDWIGANGFLVDASMASTHRVAQTLLQNGLLSTSAVGTPFASMRQAR